MPLDIALGCADVAPHQQLGQLGQLAVTVGNGIENPVVFGERLTRAVGRCRELDAVHTDQLVQLVAQQLGQRAVTAALDNPVMEVEVAFLLVIADTGLKRLIALVGAHYPAQVVDFRLSHAFGRQAAGHAFQ